MRLREQEYATGISGFVPKDPGRIDAAEKIVFSEAKIERQKEEACNAIQQ